MILFSMFRGVGEASSTSTNKNRCSLFQRFGGGETPSNSFQSKNG